MPSESSISDWWTARSDRERQGALIAAGGAVAAVVGVILLPWLEASSSAAGTARVSFFDVMSSFRDIESELSFLEGLLLGNGWIIPLIAGAVALGVAGDAFMKSDSGTARSSSTEAAGAVMIAAGYFGWIVYAVNRDLSEGSDLLFALAIDARVGAGAWLTLAGLVAVAGGVLYGAPRRSASEV